jgi:putative selenate reductase
MDAVGATDIAAFIRTPTPGDEAPHGAGAATLRNTNRYVDGLTADPRYALARNDTAPRKIGSMLELFDCITCDKCIPVCPNDANFVLPIPPGAIPVLTAQWHGEDWIFERGGTMELGQKHQIATFADFCNECGNCDVFCPEDGGPYIMKPRFFGSQEALDRYPDHDGFVVDVLGKAVRVVARIDGVPLVLDVEGSLLAFRGPGFAVRFDVDDPEGSLVGNAEADVPITQALIMFHVQRGVLDDTRTNHVNAAQ